MDLYKSINVFEPKSDKSGAEVTLVTPKGRKTFHLRRPNTSNEQPPLAIESFAVEPEHYAELMKRVESLNRFSK
ncbi:MAG: hypothetical protein HN548_00265 [Opitutae bacterium]|jgi:hypothetical protein|nr:hypothetical protein [Opitutae bacterium]